jgi:hypothetical protein
MRSVKSREDSGRARKVPCLFFREVAKTSAAAVSNPPINVLRPLSASTVKEAEHVRKNRSWISKQTLGHGTCIRCELDGADAGYLVADDQTRSTAGIREGCNSTDLDATLP